MKYICDVCGWEYDEEKGYPEGGIAPAVGEQLAKLIVTGKTDVDIQALHYDRYKAKI